MDEEQQDQGKEMELLPARPPTPRARLEKKKDRLEKELFLVTEALEALNNNPQVEEVVAKIGKVLHY